VRHEIERPDEARGWERERSEQSQQSPLGRFDARSLDAEDRIAVTGRHGLYHLRPSETVALRNIGAFQSVRLEDLKELVYSTDSERCREDVRHLRGEELVGGHIHLQLSSGARDTIVTLRGDGVDVARACMGNPRQAVYSGLSRPADLSHDTAVYRMYHAEAARIGDAGGRIQRVVLERELKAELSRVRASAPVSERQLRGEEAAAVRSLHIVSGSVQIPDLRIEYETGAGDPARVDLELVTHHYQAAEIAAKARAGFRMYAPAADLGRLHRIIDERCLMVEILSL
jgi:hypothetical protein